MPDVTLTLCIFAVGTITLIASCINCCTRRKQRHYDHRIRTESNQSTDSVLEETTSNDSHQSVDSEVHSTILRIPKSPQYYANEECSICLEPMGLRPMGITECCHHFHYDCICEWKSTKNVCPLCLIH